MTFTESALPMLGDDMPMEFGNPNAGVTSGIDFSTIDQNLTTINHTEATWGLPSLPDVVKLDLLANQGLLGSPVGDFLNGLASDITAPEQVALASTPVQFGTPNIMGALAGGPGLAMANPLDGLDGFTDATAERYESVKNSWTTPARLQDEDAFINRLRKGFQQVGNPGERSQAQRPWVIAKNGTSAILALQEQAIEAGILEPGSANGIWTPELRSARAQLMNQQANSEMAGDRGGAISFTGAVNLLDEWTSPSGLLAAAVSLDFVPDLDNIAEEYENWGESMREWKDDFWNPKKAIAALGPIDDIALPILNTALLVSGVGGVGMFAVRSMVAARGGMALSGAMAANAAKMGEAGFLATKLSRGSTAAIEAGTELSRAQKAGSAMTAWRNFTTVQIAKKTAQEGMKLGLVSQIESTVFSTGRDDDRYSELMNLRTDNPIGMALVPLFEFTLAPSSIFQPGRVRGLFDTSKTKAMETFVNPLVNLGDVEKQAEWMEGFMPYALDRLASEGPEGAARAKNIATTYVKNPTLGLAAVLDRSVEVSGKMTDVSRAAVGDRMRHLIFSAGLEKKLLAWTKDMDITTPYGEEVSRVLRKKFLTELRDVPDPPSTLTKIEDFDYLDDDHVGWVNSMLERRFNLNVDNAAPGGEALAAVRANRHAEALKIRKAVFGAPAEGQIPTLDKAFEGDASQSMLGELWNDMVQHKQQRVANANDMMADLSAEDLVGYVERFPDVLNNSDRWDDFADATDLVDDYFTHIEPGSIVTRASMFDGVDNSWAPDAIADEMNMMVKGEIKGSIKSRLWRVFDFEAPTDQLAGHMGVMAIDKIDKQQATRALAFMKMIRFRQKVVAEGAKDLGESELWRVYGQHIVAQQDWSSAGTNKLGKMYDELTNAENYIGTGLDRKGFVQYAKALKSVEAAGGEMSDTVGHLGRQMERMMGDGKFWSDVGVPVLDKSIDDAIGQLERRLPFIAATVDIDDPLQALELASKQYKAVMMVERLSPVDTLGLMDPLQDVHAARLARKSLGGFLTRPEAEDLGKLKRRQFKTSIAERLEIVGSDKAVGLRGNDVEIDNIERMLQVYVRSKSGMVTASDALADRLGARMAKRVLSQMEPKTIRDLGEAEILEALNAGSAKPWTTKEASAIKGALLEADNLGFKYRGLAHMEDAMVSKSWTMRWLQGMQGTQVEADIKGLERVKAKVLGTHLNTGYQGLQRFETARRVANMGVGAALATSFAMNNDFSFEEAALAAAGGAVGGALGGGKILSTRTITAFTGAYLGAAAVESVTGSSDAGGLAGAGIGLAAAFGGGKAATAAIGVMNNKGWAQYSKLGEGYVRARNTWRFALSPFFDAQRYTEGLTMGQAREGKILKARLDPAKYIVKSDDYDYQTLGELTGDYQRAMRSKFGKSADIAEIMQETGSQYWMERGILGFSAVEQEAAVWAQLVKAGVDSEEAVERARRVFTYGGQARSGLEQSMNFLFFPFSFQKKFLTDVGEFMADDLTRMAVLHNSMRMYQDLDEQHNLSEFARDRMPFLNQLRDVNPFAYGLSPGRLGGINAPVIQFAFDSKATRQVMDPVMNLFLPQSIDIGEPEQALALGALANQTFAAVRDFNQLYRDTVQQNHVRSSESGRTTFAEETMGWGEYTDLRGNYAEIAMAQGMNWSSVMQAGPNDAGWELRLAHDSELRALREKFPAWKESYVNSIASSTERQLDLRLTVNAPTTPSEVRFAEWYRMLKQTDTDVKDLYGVSLLDDPELAPPGLQAEMRDQAIKAAGGDLHFINLYRQFFERDLGPITKGL